MTNRIIVWFSCGAASATAAKMAITMFPKEEVLIVGCDTRKSEHPDNYRFSADCERWFGRQVTWIRNEDYPKDAMVDDVFMHRRYMSGTEGACCTGQLKKVPRFRFQLPDDVHVFGYTAEEGNRVKIFAKGNPELRTYFILREFGITKAQTYQKLSDAGIELPWMYRTGFDHNNCPGCVKSSSPWYWSMVRKHFPEVFERRCHQSRELGVRLIEIEHHKRIFLDELPDIEFPKHGKKENLSCGPECSPQLVTP